MEQRQIADMYPGETAWTLPWALHEAQGQLWLHPEYPAYRQPGGTAQMRVKRYSRGRENYGAWSPELGYVTPAGFAAWGDPDVTARPTRKADTGALVMAARHLRQWRAAIALMSTFAAVNGYGFTQATSTVGATASLAGLFAGCVSAAVCLKFRSGTLDQLARDMQLWGEEQDQLTPDGGA